MKNHPGSYFPKEKVNVWDFKISNSSTIVPPDSEYPSDDELEN